MASEVAIEVEDLRKDYGDHHAVRGISFSVHRGEVFGLLGPNGAGKTTTVEILEGYRERSGGEVAVLGIDPAGSDRSLKERLGSNPHAQGARQDVAPHHALPRGGAVAGRPRRDREGRRDRGRGTAVGAL